MLQPDQICRTMAVVIKGVSAMGTLREQALVAKDAVMLAESLSKAFGCPAGGR